MRPAKRAFWSSISRTAGIADYVEAGGPGSPNWHKSNALKTMRKRPELQGQLLAKGTWDYAIIDELQPKPGDILVPKSRYSGFFNTNMDSVLQSPRHPQSRLRRHRHQCLRRMLAARCLPSRIFRRRCCEDATHHAWAGLHPAGDALYNIETFFGWVSTVADFCGAIGQAAPADAAE